MAKLTARPNPLIRPKDDFGAPVFDQAALISPVIFKSKTKKGRQLRELTRLQTASDAVVGLEHNFSIYGFTKGQWSLSDLILAVMAKTGPADLSLCTWTAHHQDLSRAEYLFRSDHVRRLRFLTDVSFPRRRPEFAAFIREQFGLEAIRLSQVHAKLALIKNDEWSVVIRTSMNLNMNPRFEDFMVDDDAALADFLDTIFAEIWQTHRTPTLDEPELRRVAGEFKAHGRHQDPNHGKYKKKKKP